MTAERRNLIRVLWVADLLFLLAALVPGLMGRPYPRPFHPYVEYGATFIYVAGALGILAFVSRTSKEPRAGVPSRK